MRPTRLHEDGQGLRAPPGRLERVQIHVTKEA